VRGVATTASWRRGKSPMHIASNTACADCHTTFGWIPARFEHRQPLAAATGATMAPRRPASPLLMFKPRRIASHATEQSLGRRQT